MTAMLHQVFYWLFNMSITAALTGLPVLLLRRVRWLPRRVLLWLWWIPFLRMTVPVGISSRYSLLSLLTRATARTVFLPGWEKVLSSMNYIQAAEEYFPIRYRAAALAAVFRTAAVVWAAVLGGILVLLLLAYGENIRLARRAKPLEGRVYISGEVSVPGVYGILRPRILVPEGCREAGLAMLLLHEGVHLRRGDNLWRLLGIVTAAVHWFNPLGWVFLKCFFEDLELSCDERVLEALGADRRQEYARFLLEAGERGGLFASSLGGGKLRTRIGHILSFRRVTRLSLGLFLVLTGIVFYLLMTNGGYR